MLKDYPKISLTLNEAGTTYSDVFELTKGLELMINATSLEGTEVELNVIPQIGYGDDWFDLESEAFTAIDNNTVLPFREHKLITKGTRCRLKLELAGTDPVVELDIYGVVKP